MHTRQRIGVMLWGGRMSYLFIRIAENGLGQFAPILRPGQLFDDPHVNNPGATVEVTLSNGVRTQVPALPFEYGGARPDLYWDLS